jgi:hypothetical protein
MLYALLPYPTTYLAFEPVRVLSAVIVLGAAAVFFFTVGRKLLEPHDTRMKDADVLYIGAGHGVIAFAGLVQDSFGKVYGFAVGGARALFGAGQRAMDFEGHDAGWNIAVFVTALVIVIFIVVLGAGS